LNPVGVTNKKASLLGGFFVSVFWEWMKTWFDLSIKNAKAPNEVEEILSGSRLTKAFHLGRLFSLVEKRSS
jgi:hypothetical protein